MIKIVVAKPREGMSYKALENDADWREEYECFHCGEKFYSEIQATYTQEKCGKVLCLDCEDFYIKD